MSMGTEAVDQSVKIMLDGVEVALRLTGAAAKNVAVLLYTILSDQSKTAKTRGQTGLKNMLKSGKPLEIFSISNADLPTFVKEAREYGILYHVIHDPQGSPDGITDILVEKEQAPRLNRLIERFGFGTVTVEHDAAVAKEANVQKNPMAARTDQNPQSKNSSLKPKEPSTDTQNERTSVRAELQEIQASQQRKTPGRDDSARQPTNKKGVPAR